MGIFDGKFGGILLGGLSLIAGVFATLTGVGAAFGGRLIQLGLVTIVSTLLTPSGRDGDKSSPRYGFDNLSNQAHDGAPVRVIYGKERVAPTVISTTLSQDPTDLTQYLHVLMAVGEGEIDSISDIRLNDTPIDAFEDVESFTRMGTASQTVIKGFEEIGTAFNSNTKLSDSTDTHVHEGRGDTDSMIVQLSWLGGLYSQNSQGKIQANTSYVKVEYKKATDPDTKYAPATKDMVDWISVGNGTFYFTALSQQAIRKQLRIDFEDTDRYTIRITGGLAETTKSIHAPTVTSIVEVQALERAYPHTALLGLKIPAQAQLDGGNPERHVFGEGDQGLRPADRSHRMEPQPGSVPSRLSSQHTLRARGGDLRFEDCGRRWGVVADAGGHL